MNPFPYPLVTVAALISDGQGRILLLQGPKWPGGYGLPAGKVEYGESLEQAVRREVREETGLNLRDLRMLRVQEVIEDPAFHKPAHFVSIAFAATRDSGELRLNEEWEQGGWYSRGEALQLPLNPPTRILLCGESS